MASDYTEITKYNERQLGRDTASRKTQISMYSDPTHFIFEILQNADDYGATEISFRLSRRDLVIEHNGKPFREENVKAVTYFGRSTSRDDLVKTGRFGVGFKSVFAFTATPIIESGQEHFRIHGLYRIDEYPYSADLQRNRTRITLPFNHETEAPDYVDEHMAASDAYKMISSRLSRLNMNTLLFTRNIREISWQTSGKSGHYLRDDKIRKGIRHTSIINEGDIVNYLIFARTPIWKGESHKDVEVAFRTDGKKKIIPVDEYLYVLFATTQETHLKFIINGPYRTNPSRETISEEDTFNRHLIKETSELLASALPRLRDGGFLTVPSLAAMPIKEDSLRAFYSPIQDILIECFRQDDLVPTAEDTFAAATSVMQGPRAIREVVSDSELGFLSGQEGAMWAKGATPGSRPDLFLKSLEIGQWGWGELEDTLVAKFGGARFSCYPIDASDSEWLEARSDRWLQNLLLLLATAIKKEECRGYRLKTCRIIRATESKKTIHTSGDAAYFPKGRGYSDLAQVKKSILAGKTSRASKKIEDALVTLGVRQIGEEERLDQILDVFYAEDSPVLSPDRHLAHMRIFIETWRREGDSSRFDAETIFKVVGDDSLHYAEDCYLDSPLQNTGLKTIYREERRGISTKNRLWSRYKDLKDEGFIEFAVACGVRNQLSIKHRQCSSHPRESSLRRDYMAYGVKYTRTAIDNDYTIEGLEALLRLRDRKVNLLIWEVVRNADPKVLEASFRPNQQYKTREDQSTLVIILSSAEWIPDKQGTLRKPSVMAKSKLYSSFRYDNRNGWLDAIGFGEKEKQESEAYQRKKEFAEQEGIDPSLLAELTEMSPAEQAEYLKMIKKAKRAEATKRQDEEDMIPFHEAVQSAFVQGGTPQAHHQDSAGRMSRNPGRRKQKLAEEMSADLKGASSGEARFAIGLCKKWKAKNDQVKAQLTAWYGGRCQICDRTFTQRNKQPYFEGLYLVPYTKAKWIDRAGNVLCLCPWHSAQFQFGSKEFNGKVLDKILGFIPEAQGGSEEAAIELRLCGEMVAINFHEDHLLEIQTMVEESKNTAANPK